MAGVGVVALAVALFLFVEGKAPGSGQVVARVNGEAITQGEFYKELVAQQGAMVLDQMVTEILVRQEAKKQGVKVSAQDVDREMKEIADQFPSQEQFQQTLAMYGYTEDSLRRNLEINLIVKAILEPQVEATDEELQAYFQDQKERYGEPEKVQVRHILVEDEATAQAVREKLLQGADFAELAKEYSQDPGSSDAGGELGWVVRGQMVPEFEEAAFTLPVGDISEPVKSLYGWHIVQVEDHQEGREVTFDEVKDQVKKDYVADQVAQMSGAWLESLRSSAVIDDPQHILGR
ncbi:MAG: peptidylprolyl isomerase [Bacillota bacterium]|nr:peptidylprolyl isomerase [Bacillota bacterium]